MARVARPSTDPALFAYLAPLLAESRRALDALPFDGPYDPKILMRVDWGTGEPLLPGAPTTPTGGTDDGCEVTFGERPAADGVAGKGAARRRQMAAQEGDGFLQAALTKRASSLAAPQRRLRQAMHNHTHAPLSGPLRHFINEIEIHPGYYVDWDDDPDQTIEPLARAYGEYITRILAERQLPVK